MPRSSLLVASHGPSRLGYEFSQGKIFRPENPDFGKKIPFPVLPGNYFPAKLRFFRFQNSKKFIKNENRIFRPDFVAFRSDFGAFRSENIVLAM